MTICSRIVLALLVWGALSFGAVYPWGYWPLAAGAIGVGVWAMVVTRAWREPRPRAMALAFGGIGAALLVQMIPLPIGWLRTLSPAADRLLAQLEVGWVQQPPDWHSLSIDPQGTLTALALLVACGVLLVGLMRAVSYMPLDWVVGQLTVFGAVLAVFGIVQRLTAGASDVLLYGFWKPAGLATPFGPFINRNHFAGWMVMVLPLAVAAASASAQASRGPFRQDWRGWVRWLITPDASRFVFAAVAILIMATALVLTGSRSGLASFIGALAVLAWLSSRRETHRSRRVLPAFYSAVLLVAVIGWAGVSRTAARFENSAVELSERAAAWRDTVTIIRDFPIAGTGLGGYGAAMLVYQTAERQSIYVQAHNEYLQILAEGGLLVALPALMALLVIVRSIRHRLRSPETLRSHWLRCGAVAGLVGIAAQSVLEFSLQMPGNAILCVFLLAVALHRPASSPDAHRV